MVSTHLKNISHFGSFLQVGMKINKIWNHHPVQVYVSLSLSECVYSSSCFLKTLRVSESNTSKHKTSWFVWDSLTQRPSTTTGFPDFRNLALCLWRWWHLDQKWSNHVGEPVDYKLYHSITVCFFKKPICPISVDKSWQFNWCVSISLW